MKAGNRWSGSEPATGSFWRTRSAGASNGSLDRLIDFANQLVETDFVALNHALAELAQGNLSARLDDRQFVNAYRRLRSMAFSAWSASLSCLSSDC